jgi:hypothetical protein
METATSNRTARVHGTPRRTASEFLITVNRLQISLMVRDPFVAAAFRRAKDDGLAPDLVESDHPKHLDGGGAEVVGNTGRHILAKLEG